jgi:Mce-associated membrane protein
MAEAKEPPEDSATSSADAMALVEEAEAEAAAAEAMAAAAQARAHAARLRREALGLPDPAEDYGDEEGYGEDYDESDDEEYDEGYDESDDEESVAEPTRWRRWMPSLYTIAALAAVVIICAFAGLSACMVRQHREATEQRQREAAFVGGAKQGVINMISLDYNKAKEEVQRVIDGSTGQFKDDFQQRANDVISVVTQSKAVTEGTVNAAALESIDENSAVVLVSATSQITNSPPGKDEPPRMWRLRVTVAEVGGQYKMSKVEYVT